MLKLPNPIIFLAAQAKCGKMYMARMLKLADNMGHCSHEYLTRGMQGTPVIGFSDPSNEVKKISPAYDEYSFSLAKSVIENVWKKRSLPLIKEWTKEGPAIDADAKFLVAYYWLVRKYLHPKSIRIIIMHRPLESIALQHLQHGGYRKVIRNGSMKVYIKNEVFPWGNNTVTLMHKTIHQATPEDCCAFYVTEIEERKKRIKDYFPDVQIKHWDMSKDPGNRESWKGMLDWLKLKGSGGFWRTVDKNKPIHPAPKKYPGNERDIRIALNNHHVVANPLKRPDFLL